MTEVSAIHKTLIDAAIVGAQRSGTTWLANSLDLHPEISLARGKEAHLFDDPIVQTQGLTKEHFKEFYPDTFEGQLTLDATPSYLYLPNCLAELHRHNPNAKVIAILRDPGQRAISHYYHSKFRGAEKNRIIYSFACEFFRLRAGSENPRAPSSHARDHSYCDRGRYFAQINQLFLYFPDAMVIPFPLIKFKPWLVLESVQIYLGISVKKLPILSERNSLKRPKHKFLGKMLSQGMRRDTQATLQFLQWNSTALDETQVK